MLNPAGAPDDRTAASASANAAQTVTGSPVNTAGSPSSPVSATPGGSASTSSRTSRPNSVNASVPSGRSSSIRASWSITDARSGKVPSSARRVSLSSAGLGAASAAAAAADFGKSGMGSSLNRIDGQITPTYPRRAPGASAGNGA